MDLHHSTHRLLEEIGPGQMKTTAYDTAWAARLGELGEPMGESALEWLREHQLADGSWGAREPRYHHDRVICTLAAMPALARSGQAQDRIRCQRAQVALESDLKGLHADSAGETIGFEMIAPTLMAEAEALGLLRGSSSGRNALKHLSHQRATKLASLPKGMINRSVTVAFSAEMAGPDGLHLLDVENLQEANGSVGHSPAATVYFALYGRREDPSALEYLRQHSASDGGVPNVAPFDVFEQAWTLWNLSLVGPLDDEALALCQPHLDFLQAAWKPGEGAGFAADYTPKDADDTGLVYKVLKHFGRSVDLDSMLYYEGENYFHCFMPEANPSISVNIHVLDALREAGLDSDHPTVLKVLRFLSDTQTAQMFWHDKWHVSPYYSTSHAIIAAAGYADWLIGSATDWMLATQGLDGAWGYYGPTAEETAYCLQALSIWKRNGYPVPDSALERGAAWLKEHAEPPYPPFWVGKCLYSPELVIRSAVLSALMLVEQT